MQRRDLIRRTSHLLSSPVPLGEILGQFAVLLASFIDAPEVLLAIGDEHDARFEYTFQNGIGGRPENESVPEGSTTHQVLSTGEPVMRARPEDWPAVAEPVVFPGHSLERTVSAVFVPVSFGGRVVGVLSAQSHRAGAYDQDDVAMLESCAIYLGARIQDERERAEKAQLKQAAATDALTGIANRRAFDETLAREWNRCARSRSPLALLLLDVDFFKSFNDTYGHIAGDGCLKQIAQAIAGCVGRPGDLVARYGGEEFAIVLPETAAENAVRIAEEVCAMVRSLQIPHQGSSLGYTTVSIGCACAVPNPDAEPSALTERADAQLYRAKEYGRNRVASDAHVSPSPPVERRATLKHNLPSMRTSFLGREGEIAAIADRLRTARLVTVAGPGGVGKTRLAIEFGQRTIERYPDGVWFVDLAPITDGVFIGAAALSAMALREGSGRDPDETITAYLRDKTALLIVDNCEHLIAEVAHLVDRLLRECPRLRVLTTSREALDIPGEAIFRISTLSEADAIELFASRARAVSGPFTVTDESAIKDVCSRLDGIPLAIELAAARVKTMTLSELRQRLDNRFRILTGGRTALPRQQTLRGLIGWSYNLLGDDEKTLLRRLSIFAGAFSLGAADPICSGAPLGDGDVFDLLGHLVDKSLVQFEPGEDAGYWLLESTKEFALERLDDAGEWAWLQRRRAEHFRSSAEAAYAAAEAESKQMFAAIERHYAEYRAAFQWALSEDGDPAIALALATALHRYWYERGQWREGRLWMERVLRRYAPEGPFDRESWLLLFGLVRFYLAHASIEEARLASQQLLDCSLELGDRVLVLSGRLARGLTLFHSADLVEAHPLFEESFAIYDDLDAEERGRAMAMVGQNPGMTCKLGMAFSAWLTGREDEALRHLAAAAGIAESLDSPFQTATLHSWSALIHYLRGDLAAAGDAAQLGLALSKERGFALWLATCTAQVGVVRAAREDGDAGPEMVASALTMVEEHSALMVKTRVYAMLAQAWLHRGKAAQGLDAARRGLREVARCGERWWEPELHRLEGELLLASGPSGIAQAERSFCKAVELARARSMLPFLLRAQVSLQKVRNDGIPQEP